MLGLLDILQHCHPVSRASRLFLKVLCDFDVIARVGIFCLPVNLVVSTQLGHSSARVSVSLLKIQAVERL
jgi:hypothetical protein